MTVVHECFFSNTITTSCAAIPKVAGFWICVFDCVDMFCVLALAASGTFLRILLLLVLVLVAFSCRKNKIYAVSRYLGTRVPEYLSTKIESGSAVLPPTPPSCLPFLSLVSLLCPSDLSFSPLSVRVLH